MPIYVMDEGDVKELISAIIEDHYPELKELSNPKGSTPALRIDVLQCYAEKGENGDICGPGLKLHGYACLATIALRNGLASAEQTQARQMIENYHQEIFPFVRDWDATKCEQLAERGGITTAEFNGELLRGMAGSLIPAGATMTIVSEGVELATLKGRAANNKPKGKRG